MSRLVRLCEHWEDLGLRVMGPHPVATSIQRNPAGKPIQGKPTVEFEMCPGGEFLPEDALVIEKVEGEWPEWAARAGMGFGVVDKLVKAKANADALADQFGEPG